MYSRQRWFQARFWNTVSSDFLGEILKGVTLKNKLDHIYFWISYKDITMLISSALRILTTRFLRHVTIVLLQPLTGLMAATDNGSLLSDPATLAAKKQLTINSKSQRNSNTLVHHTLAITLATLYFLLTSKQQLRLKSLVCSIRLSEQLRIRSNWETKNLSTKAN